MQIIKPPTDKNPAWAQILYYTPLYGTRFTLGLAELLWALTLWFPGGTFARPTYTIMSHIASEEVWALVFLVSSLTQFYLLFTDTIRGRFAICFAFWNSLFWICTCFCMYLSVFPPPAAISGEAALAVAAAWVFIRTTAKE